jgi:hypothetical protein
VSVSLELSVISRDSEPIPMMFGEESKLLYCHPEATMRSPLSAQPILFPAFVFLGRLICTGVLAFSLLLIESHSAWAQIGGGGGGGGGGTGGGGGGSTQGNGLTSGVAVDAEGVLRRVTLADPTGQLARRRLQEARGQIDQDMARPSRLRKVSLTRLFRLINRSIAQGHGPDEAMQHLAGLTRIQYVFFYPDTNDVVLAGPAEGWGESLDGRMLGVQSGQPVLELQDLVVALRTFAPGNSSLPFVYCSIDPTQEGLARMQQFLSRVGRQIRGRGDTQFIVNGLRESLGLQIITVGGVPATTHLAQVLVEADYRMKLIGIGLEQPLVGISSFASSANPAAVSRNALQRWYFVPDYQRVMVSTDNLSAELVGNGVKLVGENEVISRDGSRQQAGGQSRASRKFTQSFTKKYAELAQLAPVYAQLRNCIDLLVTAALIQKQDYYEQADWDLGALGEESQYAVETYNAPKQVASAVNSMWKGNRLMTPIGGGVEIRPNLALESSNLLEDNDGKLEKLHAKIKLTDMPASQWWWD